MSVLLFHYETLYYPTSHAGQLTDEYRNYLVGLTIHRS